MLDEGTDRSKYMRAMAAGEDAANRNMKKDGRSVWNEEDYAIGAAVVDKILNE